MKIISRRTFVKGTAMAASGLCVCGLGGCATFTGVGNTPAMQKSAYLISGKKISVNLSQVNQLKKVGGSVKIVDEALSDSFIIVRVAEDDYVASSIHCTHRGTEVEFQAEKQMFKCASIGGSEFKLDGTVVSGPAESDLQTYSLSLSGDILVISV